MRTNEIREIAKKYALQNAINFKGKANPKAVAGKIIAELKDGNISPKEIFEIANKVCLEISKIPLEKQINQFLSN